jgi:hypothetical protein
MKEVNLVTNLSAANVSKLKEINLSHTSLTVSYYGDTVEKFKEMTVTNGSLFKIVHRKLEELKTYRIPHTIGRRDINWNLNYDDKEHLPPLGAKKCPQHQRPRISPQGDVTFCKFIVGRSGYIPDINFGNLHDITLREALSNPLRYKFFDTESICRKHCVDVSETCVVKPTLTSYKLMALSKKQYETDTETTNKKYKVIEIAVDKSNEIIQRTQQ